MSAGPDLAMTPLRTLFCRRASGEWGLASRLSDSTTMLWVDGRMVRFGCVVYVFWASRHECGAGLLRAACRRPRNDIPRSVIFCDRNCTENVQLRSQSCVWSGRQGVNLGYTYTADKSNRLRGPERDPRLFPFIPEVTIRSNQSHRSLSQWDRRGFTAFSIGHERAY